MQERGLKLKVVGIADGHHALFTRAGVDLSQYKEELAEKGMPSSTQVLHDEIIGMNIFNSVLWIVQPVQKLHPYIKIF